MVDNAVEEGFNVIVMPGYLFGATIVEVMEEYSDITSSCWTWARPTWAALC